MNTAEEYTSSDRNKFPFVLNFPPDSIIEKSKIDEIRQKKDKTVPDLWRMARYYHVTNIDLQNPGVLVEIYKDISAMSGQYRDMALSNLACFYFDNKMYLKSEKLFHGLIETNTKNISVYYNLYIIYKYLGRVEDSVKTLVLMREKFPGDIFARVELGDFLLNKDKLREAEEMYIEAIKADPASFVPYYRLAKMKESLGKYEDAEKYYEICMGKGPDLREVYIDYSRLLMSLNKNEKAKKIINIAIEKFGNNK